MLVFNASKMTILNIRPFKTECNLIIITLTLFVNCDDWLDPLRSRLKFVHKLDKIPVDFSEFTGNISFKDHFKLLEEGASSILVGSRNVIYNLSLPNLQEIQREVSFLSETLMRFKS